MQIPGGDLLERFEVILDKNAEPADWDDALADFLLAYVKRKSSTPAGPPTADEALGKKADQQQKDQEAVAKRQGCQ